MRYSLLCLLLLAVSQAVMAQAKLGLTMGGMATDFNYQKEISNPEYSNEQKVGGTGGIKLDVPLGKASSILHITPELFINQNGTRDEYYTSWSVLADSLAQNKVALDYIGLYLPVKLNFPLKNGKGLFFTACFYSDYTLTARVESDVLQEKTIRFASTRDKIDYGIRASFALLFQDNMGFEFGYNHGIKNIEFNTQQNNNRQTNYLINNKGFTVAFTALF